MNRNEIRMKLWCDVFATQKTRNLGDESAAQIFADESVDAFDKRFPAESSEQLPVCNKCGQEAPSHDYGCDGEWDEPKRMWVTFDSDGGIDSIQAYKSEAAGITYTYDYISGYAEFQQVGPMVRRDDE